MPKYLLQASYNADGAKGLLKEGGTSRKTAIEQLVKNAEGKVESIYWALGDEDAYVTVDLPNHVSAAALSMNVAASGLVRIKTTPLLTAEEVDQASRKTLNYRAPGK